MKPPDHYVSDLEVLAEAFRQKRDILFKPRINEEWVYMTYSTLEDRFKRVQLYDNPESVMDAAFLLNYTGWNEVVNKRLVGYDGKIIQAKINDEI